MRFTAGPGGHEYDVQVHRFKDKTYEIRIDHQPGFEAALAAKYGEPVRREDRSELTTNDKVFH